MQVRRQAWRLAPPGTRPRRLTRAEDLLQAPGTAPARPARPARPRPFPRNRRASGAAGGRSGGSPAPREEGAPPAFDGASRGHLPPQQHEGAPTGSGLRSLSWCGGAGRDLSLTRGNGRRSLAFRSSCVRTRISCSTVLLVGGDGGSLTADGGPRGVGPRAPAPRRRAPGVRLRVADGPRRLGRRRAARGRARRPGRPSRTRRARTTTSTPTRTLGSTRRCSRTRCGRGRT